MGRFSKLLYLGMKLGHWPKFQKLHIYYPSTPGGRNWACFHSTASGFRDTGPIFKIAIFGHETWRLAKVPEVAHVLSFYPKWSKLRLFSLYVRGFRDTDRFLKLPYLDVQFGNWPKFQKLHIYSLSTPRGRNWAYFRSTASGFRDTGPIWKLPYLALKLGSWSTFLSPKFHSI